MSEAVYYLVSLVLSLMVLLGIRWMSRVDKAARGNRLSALAMLAAIIILLLKDKILDDVFVLAGIAVGVGLGLILARRVKMIEMPQMVALLNGLGGAASAIAAYLTLRDGLSVFGIVTAMLALGVGALTLSGSLVAAGKLQRLLPQGSVYFPFHHALTVLAAVAMATLIVLPLTGGSLVLCGALMAAASLLFGLLFALPVGGADMPITISLLNALSGVAAAIAGMALGDVLLVAVGGIVGASGLLLTQIMSRAMNRRLSGILFSAPRTPPEAVSASPSTAQTADVPREEVDLQQWLTVSRNVVIIPGYGMALSQAQDKVRSLSDKLERLGKTVRFAIHPVAGRMPGHMNVLLAEVDVPYDKLFEMDDINPLMPDVDLAVVIGANDVINPAANTAEGTPIYGMPVLNAGEAKRLIICNFDLKPGYAGVPNPLYDARPHTLLLLGDAKDSLDILLAALPG